MQRYVTLFLYAKGRKTKQDVLVFKSITRILAGVLHIREARRQITSPRGNINTPMNSSFDFLSALNTLLKDEWPLMERLERQEVNVNALKSLRLILDEKKVAERVMTDYPELLIDCKNVILEN